MCFALKSNSKTDSIEERKKNFLSCRTAVNGTPCRRYKNEQKHPEDDEELKMKTRST